jgi:hypothetical protein
MSLLESVNVGVLARRAQGYSGDGGSATQAQLNGPYGVAITAESELVFNFLVPDSANNEVRAVSRAVVLFPFPIDPVLPV